jgi:hypothetical protein
MTDLVTKLLRRDRDEAIAHCPNDDWDFMPRYTDGVCPIDGWRPENIDYNEPLVARIDWFWPSMVFLALVSVAMAIAVIVTYVRT